MKHFLKTKIYLIQFKKFLSDLNRIKLILSDLKWFINTHTIKLITEENFFLYIYKWQTIIIKITRKNSKKKHIKDFQNLSEQENRKGVKKAWEKYPNLKKKKKKIVSIITIFLRIKNRSYWLYEKLLFGT